ncbi:MAG: DNA replication and repair protein RecF [Dehalococcoidia bacterium]|nr:DNA replication and repair protein RecF [Dehalococcoidia bacterium]
MHLAHLSLTNVRTFRKLELDLRPGAHVIAGDNAQGKTNLLESIALLATTRSSRPGPDADLISWDASAEELTPVARLAAEVEARAGEVTLEIAVIGGERPRMDAPLATSRRFRVNGIARRASDLIGQLRVVMFSADDLRIIDGPPANRRRYLDITNAQLDPAYVRASQRYARVLQQRNSLLRRLQERRAKPDELDFWDEELSVAGAVLLAGRARSLQQLGAHAAERYIELTSPEEPLEVCYRPAVPDDVAEAFREHDLAGRFRAALEDGRRDDILRGLTRIGPHRDDVGFLIDGREAAASASRGQQRTAGLALRLAEVALSTERTGEAPVLLLDDILSELDPQRRERVMQAAYGVDQVIITSPDEAHPSQVELPGARRYHLRSGALTLLS